MPAVEPTRPRWCPVHPPAGRAGALAPLALAGLLLGSAPTAAQGVPVTSDALPSEIAAPAGPGGERAVRVILQGLDKTTARVSTVEAVVGGIARFGTLEIIARACHKKPPTEPPESAAFLEIIDVRPDSPAVRVFNGWMFASSPALSALEHPVYDVWVIDCRKGELAPSAARAAAPQAPPEAPILGEIPEDSEAFPAD